MVYKFYGQWLPPTYLYTLPIQVSSRVTLKSFCYKLILIMNHWYLLTGCDVAISQLIGHVFEDSSAKSLHRILTAEGSPMKGGPIRTRGNWLMITNCRYVIEKVSLGNFIFSNTQPKYQILLILAALCGFTCSFFNLLPFSKIS